MPSMTKPLANPSPIALARRHVGPGNKVPPKKRGVNKNGDIPAARSRGTDTSNLSPAEMAEVIDPNKPLTEKMRLFVKGWAAGDTIQNAAARAGYASPAMAYRLTRMPNVLAVYNAEKQKYEASVGMTRQKVMDGLLEAVEMAKLMAEPMTMVSGWREIGKMCGYYAPVEHRMKVDVAGNIVLNKLNSLSDEELLALISEGTPAALPPPEEDTEDEEQPAP